MLGNKLPSKPEILADAFLDSLAVIAIIGMVLGFVVSTVGIILGIIIWFIQNFKISWFFAGYGVPFLSIAALCFMTYTNYKERLGNTELFYKKDEED